MMQREPYAFGLEGEHIQQLEALQKTPQWRIFTQLLEDVISFNVEAMLASRDEPDLHFRRGVVWALRHARDLPATVATQMRMVDEHKRRKRESSGNGWKSALFGSPWWDLTARFRGNDT